MKAAMTHNTHLTNRSGATRRGLAPIALATLALGLPAAAWADGAAGDAEPKKIRDNLFLLEEAYNQEPGVIQHIQGFVLESKAAGWSYSFTEEWPVPTDLHQLSVTIPVSNPGENSPTAIGDVLLNYRLQALGLGGVGAVAMAPRLSVVFPTGDYRKGSGRGAVGAQFNLPVSIDLGRYFVTHLNAGFTLTPRAKAPGGYAEAAFDTNAGIAMVWLPASWVNGLVEVVHTTTEDVRDNRSSARSSSFIVNPGVRFAIDFPSGLQIVPGLSAPVQFGDGHPTVSALAYLSLEHPAWSPSAGGER